MTLMSQPDTPTSSYADLVPAADPTPALHPTPAPAAVAYLTRNPERGSRHRADLDAVLDAGRVATVSVAVDNHPWVVPMLYGRFDDRVIIHGSTGAGLLRAVAAGAPAAICVTHIDGLVYAESLFESSANYRSAVVMGPLVTLTGNDAFDALDALSDRVMPGRRVELRPHKRKELAATLTLAVDITADNWIVKTRTGPPDDPTEESDVWRGVLPMRTVYGEPVTAPGVPEGTPVSPSVLALRATSPA